MIFRHVFVVRSILGTIRDEVRRAPLFKETGGPLVGYVSTDGAMVITHAAGPGPRARLGYSSVTIDGEHAQAFCDRVYSESSGRLDYVGDWHRHPGWTLRYSDKDIKTMREIAAAGYCSVKNPLSLIFRSLPEKYVVYELNDDGKLQLVPTSEIDRLPGQ